MSTLIDYKCPCCGGAISFDSTLQKMKCPYCDTEFDVEALKTLDEKLNVDENLEWNNQPEEWSEDETTGLVTYVCNSCGGSVVGDQNTAATSCPYCGNPVVMSGKLSGALKPDYVIPFKQDKKAAKEALKRHYKGKILLPKAFKDENHIDEIKGIYVPFWLFDANVDADMRYNATRVRTWSDSNYDYTETSYFNIIRAGNVAFEHIPVDGSSKMPDDIMESIEPFRFNDAVDFQTAYLAGYLADKYDVDDKQSVDRANTRIKNSTDEMFRKTVSGYATLTPTSGNVSLSDSRVKYALYPVWILNTNWNGKKYTFAMNGQTGKLVGDMPVDKGKFHAMLWGITAAVAAAAFAVQYLLWLF